MTATDPIPLTQALIRCPSVTPDDAGALGVLEAALTPLGFKCKRLRFEAEGTPPIENLYARLGTARPNFVFAGHTDVVPPGERKGWRHDPFAAEIANGVLYGRGAADMKSAIAAFVAATRSDAGNGLSIAFGVTTFGIGLAHAAAITARSRTRRMRRIIRAPWGRILNLDPVATGQSCIDGPLDPHHLGERHDSGSDPT